MKSKYDFVLHQGYGSEQYPTSTNEVVFQLYYFLFIIHSTYNMLDYIAYSGHKVSEKHFR